MSSLFLRTLREDPADAEVASHRLLVRAGYVRRVAAGIYSWLPLGVMVLRNIENIVREEMDRAGFQEVHFPGLLPREPYERTNRWNEYGGDLFRLQDRKGGDYLLGPTHEEMFTLMVKGEYSSYKDVPLVIYQIQTKYRDEPRPRSGIIRGREFIMKDSYSFDIDDEGLKLSYERHRAAYIRTFDRLGLTYSIVSAMSGAMGGSRSEEFLAPCETGEDTYVLCPQCGYAANVEAMTTPVAQISVAVDHSAIEILDTPNTPTIDSLVAVLNARYGGGFSATDTLKNILLMADGEPISVLVPGDREVDLKRLGANLPSVQDLRLFEEADFALRPNLAKGYVGPQDAKASGLRLYADPRVAPGTAWVTGANQKDRHARNVVAGRDFEVDQYVEAAEVRAGDACPKCGTAVVIDRAIEIGHIFQLGRLYAEALDLTVLDAEGKQRVLTMGSYGIGVSRGVAAVAEQTLDSLGLCWPREIAPADVHLVATGKDEQPFVAAEELVGRGLATGTIEVRDRKSGERKDVAIDEAATTIIHACQ